MVFENFASIDADTKADLLVFRQVSVEPFEPGLRLYRTFDRRDSAFEQDKGTVSPRFHERSTKALADFFEYLQVTSNPLMRGEFVCAHQPAVANNIGH
jgi:hypothetical protein